MKTFADNLDVYKILLAAAHINNCVVSAHNYLKTAFKGTLYGNSLSILEFVRDGTLDSGLLFHSSF